MRAAQPALQIVQEGGAETFDHGAESGQRDGPTEDDAGDAEGSEAEDLADEGTGTSEQLAGKEAKDHGGDGGDEVEGCVAAVSEGVGFFSREEIEKPAVEGGGNVCVLFPVGGETLQSRPVAGEARGLPIEVSGWQRVDDEGEPTHQEDKKSGKPLGARAGEGEQEDGGVAEADLGEDVGKDPNGTAARCGGEEDGEEYERDGAPKGVGEHSEKMLAAGAAVGD